MKVEIDIDDDARCSRCVSPVVKFARDGQLYCSENCARHVSVLSDVKHLAWIASEGRLGSPEGQRRITHLMGMVMALTPLPARNSKAWRCSVCWVEGQPGAVELPCGHGATAGPFPFMLHGKGDSDES